MTKEKIIDVMQKHWHQDGYYTASFDGDSCADELLALFKQELLERLEQLHAEMDERMREEVAIEKRMGEKKAENLLNQIEELTTGKCALRCPLVEQEKKEQTIDILKKIIAILQEEADGGNYAIGVRALAEDCEAIAKEYGVELMKTLNMARGNGHTNDFYNDTLVELYMNLKNGESENKEK